MENKTNIPRHIIFIIFLAIISALAIVGKIAYGLAGVSVYEFSIKDSESQIKLLQELLKEKEEKPKQVVKKPVLTPKKDANKPIVVVPVIKPSDFDIDKLARAVALAETGDCKKGYGVSHRNCHGIKKGNTYPCKTKPGNKMCVFKDKEESYKAFKIIWMKWYKTLPTYKQAVIWSGNDDAVTWRQNVLHHYEK